MDQQSSTLHEAMQKSLGEGTSWEDRRKLTRAIFEQIKSNLFPKNDYKWGERKQGEEGIYAEPDMLISQVSGYWKKPLARYLEVTAKNIGASTSKIMRETGLDKYHVKTLKHLVGDNLPARSSRIPKIEGESFSKRLKLRDELLQKQETATGTFLRKVAEDEAIESSLGIPKPEANRLLNAITEGTLKRGEVSSIVQKYANENGKLMIEKMSEADYMKLFASHGGEGWREMMHRRYLRLQK